MDLILAAKAAQTAVRFVEGGPLAAALAELNLNAALNAMQKSGRAVDQRAQVWSAVNHLEGAEAALGSKLKRWGGIPFAGVRASRYERTLEEYRYICGLLAICYRYLGEETLAQESLSEAVNPTISSRAARIALLPGYMLASASLVGLPGMFLPNRYEVDWSKFRLPPRGLPITGPT